MAVASWMLRSRSLRAAKTLRNRTDNKEDIVHLDFNLDPCYLMQEILSNICQRNGVSSIKKLNYLNAFVQLINKNPDWKISSAFGLSFDEILCCLRVALIQDSVQVRAAGLRALRYVVQSEDDVLTLNRMQFPYLIARSLDLLLKSDNERVLMSERIQSLKMMRHILYIAPQHFGNILAYPLVSVALRPVEETDRLLKACLAVLCELAILNSAVFIKCDGVRALLRNVTMIPSSHMVEAICGALLFLVNKPVLRMFAEVDFRFIISSYTNSVVVEKNTFREEERRLMWTNFVLLTLLKSCSGVFELCNCRQNMCGLKSIIQTLYINNQNIRKAILELLCELLSIPQPEWTDDENIALESIQFSRNRETFKLSEGFLVSEGKIILPNFSKTRVNLTEVHTSLLLICLLDAGLPDILVEVIVSSDVFVSLQACIFLGQFLHLTRRLLPLECYFVPPSLPNLVSYAIRGCPLQSYLAPITYDLPESMNKLNEPCFSQFSSTKNFPHNIESTENMVNVGDSTKGLDVKLSLLNLDVPENCSTKSFFNDAASKVKIKSVLINDDDTDANESTTSRENITADFMYANVAYMKPKSWDDSSCEEQIREIAKVLNINRVDFPSCKLKQRMALSAVNVLTSLQKILEKPRTPVSMLLNNVIQYGDCNASLIEKTTKDTKKKLHKIPFKDLEELLKDTGVLTAPDASRWKWESVRMILKLSSSNAKILNDANFKLFLRKLVYFYKPSSKKFSHTPLKYDVNTVNIYSLVACDLIDILLNGKNNDGVKFLLEFLEDLDDQLKQLTEIKSVHDCLLSPQRLTNSLSQDYFLLIGRLSNSEMGLLLLQKANILQRLNYVAVNINLDCYVKLIISSLSYVHSDITRKLFSAVLSCTYVSSRLYATRFLHILLRTSASNHENFRSWSVEMLVNQLHDENQTIKMIALNALNEAVDNKDYLDVLVSLRPSLLHLGDDGLLLLIRFLSTEKGFSYLQAANFINPQLQRWASSFNVKYTQIVEGELHDAMSQYQRGDDGCYRRRITGNKAVLKDVFVPPHLYGQLVQHWQGFNLLLKQENIHKMIQIILVGNYETDETILELKSALWAIGHFSTSSAGSKYLSDRGVVKVIVDLAEKATVYSVKATAFYVMSLIATTKGGVTALYKTSWRCLKRNRHDSDLTPNNSFSTFYLNKFSDDEDSEIVSSPLDFESPHNYVKTLFDPDDDDIVSKDSSKLSFEKKSATLPHMGCCSNNQVLHNRSYSESKADGSDDWMSSDSPPSHMRKYLSEINRSNTEPTKYYADSCGTDSTSGISSSDSVHGKLPNLNEKISTLSPIPSSSSLNTLISDVHQKEHRTFHAKRQPSISFNCRLSAQNALGYKTFRLLQNRHSLSNTPNFSASATIEYLSAHDRRQMSPLVRPKFPYYLQKPFMPEFEIRESSFHIDKNESAANISATIESSQFSHSTEIDDDKTEISGPCYQGICLPLRLSSFIPKNPYIKRNTAVSAGNSQSPKLNDDNDLSGESDTEQMKCEIDRTFVSSYKRRRHDKPACLLCSSKSAVQESSTMRSRKTSTSSVHRIRTETESSYGGGVGQETESPILLTWQQKPVGLVDTPGNASSSTLGTSESQNVSTMASNEHALKSRSILRKEVLKLIDQLGNPVLYKTCKQGLLQLKQICGDLFQDICLFSDVSSSLGRINYRIQARQLIQDLFLDTQFLELYEEACDVLGRTSLNVKSESAANVPSNGCPLELNASQTETAAVKSPAISKEVAATETAAVNEERKTNANNGGHLEVIIEADAVSDTTKSDICWAQECGDSDGCGGDDSIAFDKLCDRRSSLTADYDKLSTPKLSLPVAEEQFALVVDDNDDHHHHHERPKYRYDCRRAYSYPVTDRIVIGSELEDAANVRYAFSCKLPTVRSRSVSATCSYISEISVTRVNDIEDRLSMGKHSLISLRNQSPSMLLTIDPSYDLLTSQILIKNRSSRNNVFEGNDSSKECGGGGGDGDNDNNDDDDDDDDEIIVNNVADVVQRHRKLATFESPDQTVLLKHDPNI